MIVKSTNRRRFLQLAACAAALPGATRKARALDYPTRPIHLVVGFPAGGPVDLVARLIGQRLSEQVGQPVVVENRVGGAGNMATAMVTRAPPDGYTLLQVSSANSWNAALYENLKFNFVKDIAPVASIYRGFGVMLVQTSFPARTIGEFIEYARANPGKLQMGSGGVGGAQHLYGTLFRRMTGIDMLHVPYRGGIGAVTDLLGGRIHVVFEPIVTSIAHIRAGELRALGVTTATRVELLPDVPAIAEVVPGYEATGWQGIGAPQNTPVEIIDRLNSEVNSALADSSFRKRLSELGALPFASSPVGFSKFISEYTEKWAKLIQDENIKLD